MGTSSVIVDLLAKYAGFCGMSLGCIYMGSRLSTGSMRDGKVTSEHHMIRSKEVFNIPLVSGLLLTVLYLAYSYLPAAHINYILNGLFLVVFVMFSVETMGPSLHSAAKWFKFNESLLKSNSISIPYLTNSPKKFCAIDVAVAIFSALLFIYYILTKSWVINNLLALFLGVLVLATVSLNSYIVGFTLLFLLIFYDMFWVFASDAMVTIAKSIDIPAKLLLPRSIFQTVPPQNYSLLGLGDIILPGFFISLLHKYDAHRSRKNKKSSFIYCRVATVAYSLGLGLSMLSQHVFNHPQPALLYINPACIISSIATALTLRDLKNLVFFRIDSRR